MTTRALRKAILALDPDAVRAAVLQGEELDRADEYSMTPLLYAVYQGNFDAVRILLEAGADPNFNPTPSDPSHTPLWHAEHDFGLCEIASLLRGHGAVS